jgi:hypothetical protein
MWSSANTTAVRLKASLLAASSAKATSSSRYSSAFAGARRGRDLRHPITREPLVAENEIIPEAVATELDALAQATEQLHANAARAGKQRGRGAVHP